MFSDRTRLWQTGNWRKQMKSRTVHLPILSVEPGMVLALPITDHAGRILFAAGTELDAEMLDRLNKRGVESLAAQVIDTRDAETIDKELIAAESRVRQIFRGAGSPARDALQAAILRHREENAR